MVFNYSDGILNWLTHGRREIDTLRSALTHQVEFTYVSFSYDGLLGSVLSVSSLVGLDTIVI